MKHFDVIISGCGPTGGVLANLLARKGVSVCMLERHEKVYPRPRAIVLDWEVMRSLQSCGVADTLFPLTKPHPGTNFLGLEGQIIKLFDPAPPPYDLGWPATLTFIQPELERMLRDKLAEEETAALKFGHELVAFADQGDHVLVTFRDTQTSETHQATADFLIGCDGANSRLRNDLGLTLDSMGFDEWWLVVDAWQQRDTVLPAKTTQYCWPSRPATYVVGPRNLRRWELKLLPNEKPSYFDDPEVLNAAIKPFVDIDAFEIWRHAVYRFGANVSRQWSKGRVFLAGDAVHTTPPFLAQGLCAGLRDAFNLGWRLTQVLKHGANPVLMASYEDERRPHVTEIVAHAKEFGLIIGEMDVERARARDEKLGALLASGKMVTTRQKFIPDLKSGVISGADSFGLAGSQMVQPKVADAKGRVALLDEFAPMTFLYLTSGSEPQNWMTDLQREWLRIGGKRIAMVKDLTQIGNKHWINLRDEGNVFARWEAATGCSAVIVRPDRYVFSGITDAADLRVKFSELTKAM